MKNKIHLIPLLFFICTQLYTQQLPYFSQYIKNFVLVAPALTQHNLIYEEFPSNFGITYRNQWTSLESSPKTYSIRGEHVWEFNEGSRYNSYTSITFGGAFVKDEIGPSKINALITRLGVNLEIIPESIKLMGGISLGALQFSIDAKESLFIQAGDPLIGRQPNRYAPIISAGTGIGIDFNGENYLYFGYTASPARDSLSFDQFDFVTHHYAFLGGIINQFSKSSVIQGLELSLWSKYVKAVPLESNFNIQVGLDPGNDFGILLGSGFSFDLNNNLGFFNYAYGNIAIILYNTDNVQINLGFTFYFLQNDVAGYFGNTWESDFNVSWASSDWLRRQR